MRWCGSGPSVVLAAVSLLVAAGLRGQGAATATLQVDGGGVVRVVGAAQWQSGADDRVGAARSLRRVLPAGPWRLRFEPADGGRAAPIDVVAPAGGTVCVRIGSPQSATGPVPAPDAVLAAGVRGAQTYAAAPNVRVRARVGLAAAAAAGGPVGLVARWTDADNHYRLVIDPVARQLRLERVLGGQQLLLAQAPLPAGVPMTSVDGAGVALELEVDGFRLLGTCDDEPLLRQFDGALGDGGVGTIAPAGSDVVFADLTAGPPAASVPVIAVVEEPATNAAAVDVQAPAMVDCPIAWCLRLDRPTVCWPVDDRGFEPFVLQPPAEPRLPPFACGWLDRDGGARIELHWPALPGVQLQAALVGGVVGTPDASAVRARLPWVQVGFDRP